MTDLLGRPSIAWAVAAVLGAGLLYSVGIALYVAARGRAKLRDGAAEHELADAHARAEFESKLQAATARTHDEEKAIRKDAVKRSTSTVTGQVLERVAPHLPGFTYNPRDMRFFGDPFDYVMMPGYSEGEIQEIVILEIKAGKGALNTRQRQIRNRISEGKVRWEVCHLGPDGTVHPAGGS